MSTENQDGKSTVDAIVHTLRAAFVTTQLASERIVREALDLEDPSERKIFFEQSFRDFERQPMADPLIYKPMLLDAYGEVDDFAEKVIHGDDIYVVQDIFSTMENPYVLGGFLSQPHGMLHWPGFHEYKWVKDVGWEHFETSHTEVDEDGRRELMKLNPDLSSREEQIYSRLWFAYASMRTEYYNPDFLERFDEEFPQWRHASLVFDAMLLDRTSRNNSIERVAKRGRYIQQTCRL